MHSHDRTLLASMGFADPDKRDDRHDAACRYMATDESYIKLIKRFVKSSAREDVRKTKHSIDYHITKGDGKYRTTVGFADVVVSGGWEIDIPVEYATPRACGGCCAPDCQGSGTLHHVEKGLNKIHLLIEVKIGHVSAGEIIRQLSLYRAYLPSNLLPVVACAFPLNRAEIDSLENEGIRYVHLGSAFEDYCVKEKAQEDNRSYDL